MSTSTILERYEKLKLKECVCRVYDYPSACNELSSILRGTYSKVSKNLQSIMFQDTLNAFRLLPQVQTQSGISAANHLLQAAEAALPKQKKVMAVTEFKHAVVAHKRRCKAQEDREGSVQLVQDVLVHIFSFLDMRSLVAAGLVCWSWSIASHNDQLWQLQYDTFFGTSDCSESIEQIGLTSENINSTLYLKKEGMDPMSTVDWRESFKRAYIGKFPWRFRTNRGYCQLCKSVVWLSNIKCSNSRNGIKHKPQIKPMSSQQFRSSYLIEIASFYPAFSVWKVVEYLLEDSLLTSSSDSESDSDEESVLKLWAYPRNIGGHRKKSFVSLNT